MNFSALLMLQLSYETNSLLPGSHPHVSRGHIRSNNGANKRGEEGRGQESPQQPDCVMRKLSKEEKKRKDQIKTTWAFLGVTNAGSKDI